MASSPSHPSLRWVRSLVFIVFLQASSSSRVSLVNNGYNGLVIGIDDKLDVNECHKILANVQTLVNEASSYLYTATNRRAFFSDVTVVIPSAWPRGCTVEPPGQATTESYLTSDLRVSGPHPVHGTAPWTQQWGLCGQPGSFIQMASEFITSTTNATFERHARVLVQEWAKYRWGVFAELGFAGDPLYPSFYQQSAGQWRATGCADANVLGTVSPPGCDARSNECTFVPFSNESNSDVTSSAMYQHDLGQVRRFCDESNHNRAAPTKHNLICHEKSVWEVMQQHKDFKDGNNTPREDSFVPELNFNIVKSAPDRFFFVLESTNTMRQQTRWDFVSNSIRKFVNWDVPTGVQVGIGHFGSSYMTDRNLTTVPDLLSSRGEIANLPQIADDVKEEGKSWILAIDGALAALGGRAAGTTLIWITGNEQNSRNKPTEEDVQYMINALKDKQVRLVLVFYPHVTEGLARVAAETGGDVITVPDSSLGDQTSIDVFHSLIEAYVFTLDKYISDKKMLKVQVEDRKFAGDGQQARGSFLVDQTLGVNTTLTVLYNTRQEIGYVKLRRPGGIMEPVYSYPDSTYHLHYIRIDPVQGRWEYEIDNLAPSHSSLVVQVTSSSTTSEDTVRTEAWTNTDHTGALNATHQPLMIYASVMQGSAPVLNAQVYAVVTGPDGNDVRIQLLDDGLAVPDILHGDGIYSRYFTDFGSLSGHPSLFTVRVDVGGGSRARVVTGRARAEARWPCCGSTVGDVTTVPMYDLRRSAAGGSVRVAGPEDAQKDRYPPNRVTDLKADIDAEQRTVSFSWSAPGDDFDKPDTKVSQYEVRYSDNREKLLNQFSECSSVAHWSQPEPAGTPSLAVIDFNTVDTLLFFAIRGLDEAGNVAPLSNIVRVVMPAPATTSPPSPTSTTSPVLPAEPLFDHQLLLIVLLGVAGLILLVVLLALYVFVCRRRSRKSKPDRDQPKHNITTVAVPPANKQSREPTPVKIAYDIEKEEAERGLAEAPTPVMWSASSIMTSNEQRYSPNERNYGHYSNNLSLGAANATSRARYNSYQTPYVEDMQYDGRSLVSTQPSDSFLSLASDPRHRGNNPASEPAGGGGGGDPAQWHSDKDSLVQPGPAQRGRQGRVPPPTLPKPRMPAPLDVASSHGSRASIAGDRRRRNVTQV